HYSTIDNLPLLPKLKARGIGLYAIYGKDDGLYSPAQVEAVQRVTGSAHLRYLDRCAHAPFLDQQTEFVNALTQWLH
ncbi:MAG: alpha/beta hydrolase, partial [Siphonobacter aquaeclarae]|nr:alpha/beta hydrolase [Siphonobacter aquaeclarae]